MLRLLRIRNFALIDTLSIRFDDGLNVITGETGAGKSILVHALGLVLGGRAKSLQIRDGADTASVEATLTIPANHPVRQTLDELGIDLDTGDDLLIRRRLSRAGKNQAFINDQQVTLTGLSQIAESLVDISSQHEHLSLRDPASHIALLDRVGGLGSALAAFAQHYVKWDQARAELDSLTEKNRQRLERQEFVRFQLQQLHAAKLANPDEDTDLEQQRARMRNAEAIKAAAHTAVGKLYAQSGSAIERLDQSLKALETLSSFDIAMQSQRDALASARSIVEDVAFTVRDYESRLDDADGSLDALESRLAELQSLKRRFGPSLAEVIAAQRSFEAELSLLDDLDNRLEQLQRTETTLRDAATKAGRVLSQERRAAATGFASAMNAYLDELAMSGARFSVEFEIAPLSASGIDRVSFMLATNVGEKALPLSRVASGGELSRFMLAFKQVAAETDPVLVTVFDEVDTGIGGTVAEVVGQMIHRAARTRQVLCITHLPQIARRADTHYRVSKGEQDGRTVSAIEPLDDEARRDELARMLGADPEAEHTQHYVKSLLAESPS